MRFVRLVFPVLAIALAVIMTSCQSPASKQADDLATQNAKLTPREGFLDVPGGRVWYRIVGSGPRVPLLIVHGGPGFPSYYLKPLAALGNERPVIFYDQLGCGHSDKTDDTALFKIDRFVAELAQVRAKLGLQQVHILGQSWGTMVLTDYLLTKPQGVVSAVMASPALSAARWQHDGDSLLATLPDSVQQILKKHLADGTLDDPEYQAAMLEYYTRFVARKQPWSADIESTLAQMGTAEYEYMAGPVEFALTGTLKDYDRTSRLGELNLPVLFTCGEFDEATPNSVQYYRSLVPKSEFAAFAGTAHLTMQDDSARYVLTIRNFLDRAENAK